MSDRRLRTRSAPSRRCAYCGERLAADARSNRRYCSVVCRRTAQQRAAYGPLTSWVKRCGRCGGWFESYSVCPILDPPTSLRRQPRWRRLDPVSDPSSQSTWWWGSGRGPSPDLGHGVWVSVPSSTTPLTSVCENRSERLAERPAQKTAGPGCGAGRCPEAGCGGSPAAAFRDTACPSTGVACGRAAGLCHSQSGRLSLYPGSLPGVASRS